MGRLTRRDLLVRAGRGAALLTVVPISRVGVASAGGSRDPRLRALARAVRGPVITAASPLYATARLPFNARFDDIRPLAIVRPLDAEDVRKIVLWSAHTGVPIRARSGGHSYAGYSSTRGVVVDLADLNRIAIDPGREAIVGAGTRVIDVYAALAGHGLSIPAGSCPTVGVAGLTLGGGFGLASRAWGLTCDNLLELEIVIAGGRKLVCDRRRHSELFWACRGGGGGNFGIVTRFRFRTHRVGRASYFVVTWPWSAVDAVVHRFQQWAPHTPVELAALCRLATGPGAPSVQVFGQYLGPASRLATLLRGLTSGLPPSRVTTGTSDWLDLQLRWAGCLGKTIAQCHPQGLTSSGTLGRATFAAASDYVTRPIPPRGIATMRRWIERREHGTGSGSILLDAYGGAVNRVHPGATAFVHRDALFSCQYLAYWGASAAARPSLDWLRGLHAAMRPYVSGFAYQNYIDPTLANWPHAYYGANFRRLVHVKAAYDPHNLFHFAQSIPTHI